MTPTECEFSGLSISESSSPFCCISILRAGDAMIAPFRALFPFIPVGKILIQRDEKTSLPHLYYSKFPPQVAKYKKIFILDPMLATGGSILMAVRELEKFDVRVDQLVFVNLISCPEGLKRIQQEIPSLTIVTQYLDEKLNENNYIMPGVGDAGDRYFGTVQQTNE